MITSLVWFCFFNTAELNNTTAEQTCSPMCRWNNKKKRNISVDRGVKMRPSIFKRSLVQKQSHRQCIVNASQHSHTFDAQMVCTNFLVLPPALPLLLSVIISHHSLSRSSSLMSHILPSSHHLACHSAAFSRSASSEAPRLATLHLINEVSAKLASRVGTPWLGKC